MCQRLIDAFFHQSDIGHIIHIAYGNVVFLSQCLDGGVLLVPHAVWFEEQRIRLYNLLLSKGDAVLGDYDGLRV